MSVRPPETRFEKTKPLSYSADIWTLGCALWAICGQNALFNSSFFATEDHITCQQVDALGMLPMEWWAQWGMRKKWFTETGQAVGE